MIDVYLMLGYFFKLNSSQKLKSGNYHEPPSVILPKKLMSLTPTLLGLETISTNTQHIEQF